jgi:hypothetical protein
MNKIVIEIGLLIFFLSVIIFMQQGMELDTVLYRSIIIFIVVTVMISVLVITFIRAINKSFLRKEKFSNQN